MSNYTKNTDGTYTDLTFTRFPSEVDSWQDNVDITADLVSASNKYREALSKGNQTQAKQILLDYPSLARAMINAAVINNIKHSVMALERIFSEDIEEYIINKSAEISGIDTTLSVSGAPAEAKAVGTKIKELNDAMYSLDDTYVTKTGDSTIDGNVNVTGTITASKVYNAVYNDQAEFMPRGEVTEPGDIVALDVTSETEKYIKATKGCVRVAGVHSDEFAHLIGGRITSDPDLYYAENIKNFIPVGLTGRVRTKIVGPVHSGDLIVPSDIPGIGIAKTEKDSNENVIGYAVETNLEDGIRRVRIRLKG